MSGDIKYITQLSTEDLRQLAAAANMYAGPGIVITKNDDGLCIGIDTDMLARWIRHVVAGGNL